MEREDYEGDKVLFWRRDWMAILCLMMFAICLIHEGSPAEQNLPKDVSGNWWTKVQKDIEESEYNITWQEKPAIEGLGECWQAPNRANNLRTYFTPSGPLVIRRTEAQPSWQWGVELLGMRPSSAKAMEGKNADVSRRSFSEGGMRNEKFGDWNTECGFNPLPLEKITTAGNRIEYHRKDVMEWYVNDSKGLEQGFIITKDEGRRTKDEISLELAVRGTLKPRMMADGKGITFVNQSGVALIDYTVPNATGANGKNLPATLELVESDDRSFSRTSSSSVIRLNVNAQGAVYPFTISPLIKGLSDIADWTAEGNQVNAYFGCSVSTAGDVNGDGYADVIVGALSYDNGEDDEGRAFVYHGSAEGLFLAPNWTAESNQAYAQFGNSVATAGDVNGDGYADVIVSAPWYSNGEEGEGRVFVYHGSADGLSVTPNWTAESNQAYAHLGNSAATAGDVNRDGYADVIVGAYYYDNGEQDEGMAFVYHGSASGLSLTANWTAESNQEGGSLGNSVAGAGDVNGDGYADVIVGARGYDNGEANEGRAFVYHGSASGLSEAANWTAESNQAYAYLGNSVSTAGDVNGDGYADVIVGAYYYDNGEQYEGMAFVYLGHSGGLSTAPDWTKESNQADAYLGYSVSTAGDVNGDGYADVIIGALHYSNNEIGEGRVFVYLGSGSGLSSTANWTKEGNQKDASFGYSAAGAGDVNGDGYADVIVGAHLYDNGEENEGMAFVYYGSTSGFSPTADWTAGSNQAGAGFGWSVATAGDVNGDGYADVIVGAHSYDNGEDDEGRAFVYLGSAEGLSATPNWTAESDQAYASFGNSVATAGDVNGDGYADIIVGAPSYGNLQEGRAFVYHGSSSGPSLTANWIRESGDAHSDFGNSVATAGDVNGDGYSDVIVSAPWYDNSEKDEGMVFVYHGSADGLSPMWNWSAEGNQESALFGYSVATAGDVNGDGYADVIIGAHSYDNGEENEGMAFVYYGSAAGLSFTADWTADSNQAGAGFGWSVATAGDVNGDGYADIIVGALFYNNGEWNEGRAFVYHGHPWGLSADANWTAEGNQVDAFLGNSVSTAGDVNGDGYADVIVGASGYDNDENDEGRVFVYHGSASGISTTADWTAESNQVDSYFGDSAATAGDVNSDGYSDVIVGAPDFDNGEEDEGRAFVYLGSAQGLSSAAKWNAEGNKIGASFGYSVATAGDVNSDGYSDVIVGAPFYDNGELDEGRAFVYHGSDAGLSLTENWTAEGNHAGAQFGWSVSTAGDVNGDGYADVIVSAPYFDNGQEDEGLAFVYYGSSGGLSPTANWTKEGNQAGAQFGFSVACAGDVNGDGYGDVIIGAYGYDNGEEDEGRSFVYHGSAEGLSATVDWTQESNQAGASFGWSVATAGDVNRDGYTDVIVGAPDFDNGEEDEGSIFVYHGSASGLSLAAERTAEINQANASFGWCVSTAGDVNGDGYADVIVSAPDYKNAGEGKGRVFLYFGTGSGLSRPIRWTEECKLPDAWFGNSVATAGDVNGDGYADVIIGAYGYSNSEQGEGRAFVYYGSTSGLSLAPNWVAESNQASAHFGFSVACAGDVNGDGYADVIIGADHYSNGEEGEGRAFVYYGNSRGLNVCPQQRRFNDSAPVGPLGRSHSPLIARLAAFGRTPFGRGKIKLQAEARPLGTAFNGVVTHQEVSWFDTGAGGISRNLKVSGLTMNTVYHWRIRLRYHPVTTPFQQYSRWFTIPLNGWQEGDFRTDPPNIIRLKEYLLGIISLSTEEVSSYDFNQDGIVDVGDFIWLLLH